MNYFKQNTLEKSSVFCLFNIEILYNKIWHAQTNTWTLKCLGEIDRIFIFSKDKIKEFKNNKTLRIYMQSSINTMFVNYDEILEKEPELLRIVGNGWDGIDKNTLIVDLPEGEKERGYITKNTKEVMEAYNCFQKLKKYSKNLKEILK